MRNAAWVCLALAVACSSPPDPIFPDRADLGQPAPAAESCQPPFPMNFAQSWFVFADLDRGISCPVFLERDECAVAIYDDCTDSSDLPREWQGTVGADPMVKDRYVPIITLSTQYDETASGGRLPRSPACCEGELYPKGDGAIPVRARLTCHDTSCGSSFDHRHTGLVLEQVAPSGPTSRVLGEVTLSAAASIPDATFAGERVWAIVDDALFVYSPTTATTLRTMVAAGGSTMIRATTGGAAIYLIGDAVIRVNAATGLETHREMLAGRATAAAVTGDGLLVAYDVGDESALLRFSLVNLQPNGSPSPAGRRITGLAPLDRPVGLAVATADQMSAIYTVTGTPALSLTTAVTFPQAEALSLGEIIPTNPILIDGDTVGVIADCFANSPTRHCYFEVNVMTGAVVRVGVPDVDDLLDVAYDLVSDHLVLTSVRGRVAFIDRDEGFRPRIQESILMADHRLGAVAVDPSTRRAYVMQSERGVIVEVLQPSD